MSTKIAIIGAGAVGTTTAYALILKNIAAEIILIDIDKTRCKGEFLDLSDAIPFCKTSVLHEGNLEDANIADIIIICAGARQKIGQPRLELLTQNKDIIANIFTTVKPKNNAIIIMVTNPVDLLTLYAMKLTNCDSSHIMGSGTLLDSQRLRNILAHTLNISERSIHAYMLGEHGDSQFPAWSLATINGIQITQFPGINPKILEQIGNEARMRVYEIIKCKGSTYFGVATCVTALCEIILYDQKRLVPVSCFSKEFNICLNLPVILGNHGIEKYLPLPLSPEEQKFLKKSAEVLQELAKSSGIL